MYTSMRKIYYITTGMSFFLVGLDLALMWLHYIYRNIVLVKKNVFQLLHLASFFTRLVYFNECEKICLLQEKNLVQYIFCLLL
jgi:ABC-type transport system involved in cytochrome c biogenesis permease subunit